MLFRCIPKSVYSFILDIFPNCKNCSIYCYSPWNVHKNALINASQLPAGTTTWINFEIGWNLVLRSYDFKITWNQRSEIDVNIHITIPSEIKSWNNEIFNLDTCWINALAVTIRIVLIVTQIIPKIFPNWHKPVLFLWKGLHLNTYYCVSMYVDIYHYM